MGSRKHISRKDISASAFTPKPKPNMLQTRGLSNGKKLRSTELPTTADILQTRPFATPRQKSSTAEKQPPTPEAMEKVAAFGYKGVNIPVFAPPPAPPIQAKAFTTGQDLFFRQGAYEPGSRGGQELIAHELTHVLQQGGGKHKQPLLDHFRKDIQRKAVLGYEPYAKSSKYVDISRDGLFATPQPTDLTEVMKIYNAICLALEKNPQGEMDIKILTGSHGNKEGDLIQEDRFSEQDLVANTSPPPNGGKVLVKNIFSLADSSQPELLKAAIKREYDDRDKSAVILAWCYSQMSYNNWMDIGVFAPVTSASTSGDEAEGNL